MSLALNVSTFPSALIFLLKIHLHLIGTIPSGGSTKVQTWFECTSQYLISLPLTISQSRYLISPHHRSWDHHHEPHFLWGIFLLHLLVLPKYLSGGRKIIVDLRGRRGCVRTGSDWLGSSGSLAHCSWETFSLSLIILPMPPSWINYFSKKIAFRLTITLWSFGL